MLKKKDHINSRHRNIKFTCKEEKYNKTSFLQISICRDKNAMETSIFPWKL